MRIIGSSAPMPPGSMRLAALAGILSSVLMAELLVSLVRWSGLPLFLTAVLYTAGIVAANAMGVAAAGGILRIGVDGISWRTATTAAWIAPLAVYVRAGSIWAIPLSVVIAVKTARWLRDDERVVAGNTSDSNPEREMFSFPPPPPMSRLLALVGAAFCVQGTIATGAAHIAGAASIFASAASGIIGWHLSGPITHRPVNTSRELLSSGLTLILAFLLTMGGAGSGSGSDRNGQALGEGSGGAYWGVFLWPETASKAIELVAPPRNRAVFDQGLKLRVKIPFDGIYWFYKLPDLRPPAGSTVVYGTPDQVGFRSTDSSPLVMEAHQNLTSHVNLTCCTDIEVGVRHSDREPGTVKLELILSDSSRPFQEPLSLRQVGLGPMGPVRFHIPEHRLLTTFDEVTIRFHLESGRETVSPRIAIIDLVMIPR
jgi:hypothetical protein